jgi:hypothetical protein
MWPLLAALGRIGSLEVFRAFHSFLLFFFSLSFIDVHHFPFQFPFHFVLIGLESLSFDSPPGLVSLLLLFVLKTFGAAKRVLVKSTSFSLAQLMLT